MSTTTSPGRRRAKARERASRGRSGRPPAATNRAYSPPAKASRSRPEYRPGPGEAAAALGHGAGTMSPARGEVTVSLCPREGAVSPGPGEGAAAPPAPSEGPLLQTQAARPHRPAPKRAPL
jgi:hypothetical protein